MLWGGLWCGSHHPPFTEEGQGTSPSERRLLTEVTESLSCILPALWLAFSKCVCVGLATCLRDGDGDLFSLWLPASASGVKEHTSPALWPWEVSPRFLSFHLLTGLPGQTFVILSF